MPFEFLDCHHNRFLPLMARKSPKCAPTVEPSQTGCVWNFGGVFDQHHHGSLHRKLLSSESNRSTSLPGAGHEMSPVRMLTFDEHLRNINIESKKKTMEKSFWKKIKIKSRYENVNKEKENTNIVDRIVVLKPSQRVVECPVDVSCRCLHLHPHQNQTRKHHMAKHTHVFSDVKKKLENPKKLNMKSWGQTDETDSKMEYLSLVPYSKHQELDVFMEARRHIAERLGLVNMGASAGEGEPSGSLCKQAPKTLDRILLLSHESMPGFDREPLGTNGEKSLQRTWSGSSPLKFSDMGSDQNNIYSSPSGTDGCIKEPQLELLLDVSSPKASCKSEADHCSENPSPVSVLDLFYADNISSPTSTMESVEIQIKPRRLYFEEQLSQTSSPQWETSSSLFTEDRGFISSYVREIYQTAQSNWEDFLATDFPLEPSCDHKVLYDYVKEVLVTLHSRITLFGSRVRPFSLEKDVINKVIDQVDWHSGQPMGPQTIDHLVRRDIAKCGPWLDTLSDRNDIMVEVADEILQEMVIEAIHDISF